MRQRLRAAGRRVAKRVLPTAIVSIADLPRLQQRVRELDAELQETRRLSRRVAEVTDVVEEVLLPAADRDDDRLRRARERYEKTLRAP